MVFDLGLKSANFLVFALILYGTKVWPRNDKSKFRMMLILAFDMRKSSRHINEMYQELGRWIIRDCFCLAPSCVSVFFFYFLFYFVMSFIPVIPFALMDATTCINTIFVILNIVIGVRAEIDWCLNAFSSY